MRSAAAIALAAVGGGLLTAGAMTVTGDEAPAPPAVRASAPAPPRHAAADGAFSVALPRGWRVEADGPGATVLRRAGDEGVVVVRRRGPVRTDLPRLGRHLQARLLRELPGAEPAGRRIFRTQAGEALVTTLARGTRVQGVAVVPAGSQSFSLDLLADGRSTAAVRDLALIVRSFRPADSSSGGRRRP